MGRYSATLTGEEEFQTAIAQLSPGDEVTLRPVLGDPDSPRALRCTDISGANIGFIARDNWLAKTVLDQKSAVRTLVESISDPAPVRRVTLTVLTGADAEPSKPAPPPVPAKKPMGCLKIVGIGIAGFLGLAVIGAIIDPKPKTAPATSDAPPAPEEPDEEAIAEQQKRQKGFHCLSAWDGSHRELVRTLKNNLRDPDSFEHIETRISPVDDKGMHVLMMKYRARNGFGGMNIGSLAASVKNSDCSFEIIANADQ